MKLDAEDVLALHSRGICDAMVRRRSDIPWIFGLAIIGVIEIDVRARIDSAK
jgi:hypothetical protein